MESFDINSIVNNLAIERIYHEKDLINNLLKDNINILNKDELINRIKILDNILINLEPNKDNAAEQIAFYQFNKPWTKLNEDNKIIKINEFCEAHNISDIIKNQFISAVKNKLLNTKKQVIYDDKNAVITSIIFEKQIYK